MLFHVFAQDGTTDTSKMSAASIRSELDSIGVSYSDCFEKSDLDKRLREARAGSLDPTFYRKNKSSQSSSQGTSSNPSSHSQTSKSSSTQVETVVVEPDEVIEPDYMRKNAKSRNVEYVEHDGPSRSGSGRSYGQTTTEYYSSDAASSPFGNEEYNARDSKYSGSEAWGNYPDSDAFFRRGRVGGENFDRRKQATTNIPTDQREESFMDMFYKEFPEVKSVMSFFENPWVQRTLSIVQKPFVAIPLALFATFTMLKFLFFLPIIMFLLIGGAAAYAYFSSKFRR